MGDDVVRWVYLTAAILVLGCSKSTPSNQISSVSADHQSSQANNQSLQNANRIIVLTPALTEVVFALGYGDRVIAISNHCNYPPEAASKQQVGGPDEKKLSLERIVDLKPDLILGDNGFQVQVMETLKRFKLNVAGLQADSIAEVGKLLNDVESLLGETPASRKAIHEWNQKVKALKVNRYSNPPSVLMIVGEQPIFTAGPGSITQEIIERAGGKNLFSDVKQKYLTVNEEEIVRRNPDVIVLVRPKNPEAKKAEVLARPSWQTIAAVKNGRILFIDEDTSSRPGPRLLDAVRELETALHPSKTP